jgi:hypothetical protein
MQEQTVQAETTSVPCIPCPNCAENILAEGFYNYCTETSSLREDNHTQIGNNCLYMDHNESGHETVDHECDTEARCSSCDAVLPWPLYQIRGLDGEKLADVPAMIADLLSQPEEAAPTAPPPVSTTGAPIEEHRA